MHRCLPELERYGEQHRGEFAGVAVDPEPPGMISVGFTARLAVHADALEEICPYPRWLHLFEARRTLATLRTLVETLLDDETDLILEGAEAGGVGIDVRRNVAFLELWQPAAELRRRVEERYGAALRCA